MKTAVFSTRPYEKIFFTEINKSYNHELLFLETKLTKDTAPLVQDSQAVCAFVNDILDDETQKKLVACGIKVIALRSAGFNNVDLSAARNNNLKIVRVPAYSPYSVAEHTIALLLSLNRKTYRAYNRIREGNFALDGLMGFDLHGRSVGIIGTGKIGSVVASILNGFGCKLYGYDQIKNPQCEKLGLKYVPLDVLFSKSDIITLHCPLTPQTYHIISTPAIEQMKDGVVILNTSRGALINTKAVIRGLKSGKISYLGIDVYEEEGDLFFQDLSNKVLQDDVFARLLTFPNVMITGHQAFFTKEALTNIVDTTLANIKEFEKTGKCKNEVSENYVVK